MNIVDEKKPEILNRFLLYLNLNAYSEGTIRQYGIDLMLFFKFIKSYRNIDIAVKEFNIFILKSVTEDEIIAFLVYLNFNRNCTACTREAKLTTIKTFYKWLYKHYNFNVANIPTANLPTIQQIERLPKYLNLDKAKSLLNVFDENNSKFNIRNNTIIATFLSCGLRISELANLNLNDIDFDDKTIRVRGKGRKERTCYLNKDMVKKLKEYLLIRNKNKTVIDLFEPLFLSCRNGRLGTNSIRAIVRNAYKLAKLDDYHYTVHTLRHTSATLLYQYVKQDILLLKEFLGHESIKSTEIYTHVKKDNIKKVVESNPLANFNPKKAIVA